KQIVNQRTHLFGGVGNVGEIGSARRIQGRWAILLKRPYKTSDVIQRRAQVVRYGVTKGFEFLLQGGQFSGLAAQSAAFLEEFNQHRHLAPENLRLGRLQ